MSRIFDLINKLCPNGVEYYELGQLGKFYGGLTGKSKEDFINGNEKFITYKNVYSNLALEIDVEDRVRVGENENQRTLEYGDVIFTGSSETPDECGITSVLTKKTDEKLYLNSFCFIFRFNDVSIMNPEFAKHIFRSKEMRYQIGKTASGVTRYNVSKKLMERVKLAVPPLEVQQEIVHILDNFSFLSAELSAELKARQKQYEFYTDKLLTFDNNVEYMKLKDIVSFKNGKGHEKVVEENGQYILLTSKAISTNMKQVRRTNANLVPLYKDDITMVMSDLPNGKALAKCFVVDENELYTLNQRIGCFQNVKKDLIYNRFLYYVLNRNKQLLKYDNGVDQTNLRKDDILNINIPIPSIEKQKEIVNILDRLDKLCNDFSEGLPAEIEARKKQYEYYRDTLLDFKVRKEF